MQDSHVTGALVQVGNGDLAQAGSLGVLGSGRTVTEADPGCQANELGISLTDVGAYSFHTGLAIEFKNRGSACTITGYPGVDALSATGRRILSAKGTKSGYIGGVFSGPIPKVHLAKGKTASALGLMPLSSLKQLAR
jgi:hypothetical protein